METSLFLKLAIIIGLLLGLPTVWYFIPPIPQWESYHQFSDTRIFFSINNFANVTSNIGFVACGSYGCIKILMGGYFQNKIDLLPYLVFFLSIILVGFGSAYYHWSPSTQTLFWDRLPIAIAFMSFFSAVICDRIHKLVGTFFILPILISAGVYSLVYWQQTEEMGYGDLRLYGLVQYYPILAIPLILLLFPKHQYTPNKPILWALGWYACAKIFEYFDLLVSNILDHFVSGHTLKHLAATIAIICILRMLTNLKKEPDLPQNSKL